MADLKNVRVNFTRDELKEMLNQMADQVFDFYIEQGERQVAEEAKKRLIATTPINKPKKNTSEYSEAWESKSKNMIYYIHLGQARELQVEVDKKQHLVEKKHQHSINVLKGTIHSEGNQTTWDKGITKIGTMSVKQFIHLSTGIEAIGLDPHTIRATDKQVAKSQKKLTAAYVAA